MLAPGPVSLATGGRDLRPNDVSIVPAGGTSGRDPDRGPNPHMSIRAILQAFGTIFPAELPDKTMIATILLVTRYRRPLPVWSCTR